jgi:hypothetical protein
MDDIITGLRFSATLQLRTPLRVLRWHGHIHEGRNSPPPAVIRESWEGVWLPKTKTFRELGVDLLELPPGHMASDIGPIPVDGGGYLRFLIAVRKIVEGGEPVASRVEALQAFLGLPEWSPFIEKLSYRSSLVDYFFPPFLRTIPRLGQAAQSKLAEMHLDTPNRLAAASDDTFLAFKGIGPATLKAIRSRCAECSGAGDETRIDNLRR